MKEKTFCLVTPEGRSYFRASPVAKEFFDKDRNVVHTMGVLPEGELEEINVSAVTRKTLKNGKLNGKVEVVSLEDNKITFSEEYKDGVLVKITDRIASEGPAKDKKTAYPGTVLKTHKGSYSFYVNGQEVADATMAANGTTLEVLGTIPDGEVKEFNDNGQPVLEAFYRNNKPNGEVVRYNDEGKVISRENYQEGVLSGAARYYQYINGKRFSADCTYKNALLHGPRTSYYASGAVKTKENYHNGKLRGERTTYYRNGQMEAKENFLDGKLTGERLLYFPEGEIWYRENYKAGRLDGERFSYFPGGAVRLEEFYVDGLLEGERKVYTETGDLITADEYHWGSLVHNTERHSN